MFKLRLFLIPHPFTITESFSSCTSSARFLLRSGAFVFQYLYLRFPDLATPNVEQRKRRRVVIVMDKRYLTCRKARVSRDFLFLNKDRLTNKWAFDCCPAVAAEYYGRVTKKIESSLYESGDNFFEDLHGAFDSHRFLFYTCILSRHLALTPIFIPSFRTLTGGAKTV